MAKEFYISNKSNHSLPIIDSRPVNENDIDASYDESGNLLKLNGSQNLHWNYRDNIAYVDIITRASDKNDSEYYVYDSSGQRVRKVTETYQNNEKIFTRVEKIYFGDIEVTRTYQDNNLSKEKYTIHVIENKSRVALHHYWTKGSPENVEIKSQDRYQLSNHLDSVALELNDNAEIITYEEYLPFGGTALIAGKTAREVTEKEYRYSGKEKDESTGLYYYGARYYASWLLRWINPDPAGTVDGLNLYQFVGGNPANSVDIDGMIEENISDDMKDFVNDFKKGDLIYGLDSPRKNYVDSAKKKYPGEKIIINKYNDPVLGKYSPTSSSIPLKDKDLVEYEEFLKSEEKFNEKVLKNEDKENEYKKGSAFDTIKRMERQIARACKAGIVFKTSRGKKVHFVLDEIDINRVLDKKIYHYKNITSGELRSIYRQRNKEWIEKNVVFWKGGKKVNPPWEDDKMRKAWKNYGLKSIGGNLRKISNKYASSRLKTRFEWLIKGVGTIARNFRYSQE
ncbi:RHS repeat-associated core domain-containing protein [Wolbachia endosymbiont (group A) of Limnophora tigrina]|uniref:RHS repeat-associated core domain-containing protein n=1 Tax=Wolbachia endosymbiont (group A) of Limnophora tigrina TaxID=3139318 RepID=UPI0035B53B2D